MHMSSKSSVFLHGILNMYCVFIPINIKCLVYYVAVRVSLLVLHVTCSLRTGRVDTLSGGFDQSKSVRLWSNVPIKHTAIC